MQLLGQFFIRMRLNGENFFNGEHLGGEGGER